MNFIHFADLFKKSPDIKNAGRIGIMGGVFDPIHYGHLAAAEGARQALGLDFVLFIPTGQPSHKNTATFREHRYLMTVLATADNPHFYVSRMELDRQGSTYTIDTLRILKEETDAELFFITGADEMMQIMQWKDAADLLRICQWVSATRPGYDTQALADHMADLSKTHGLQGYMIEIPGLDISGTALRRRITSGKGVKYLIPPAVETYLCDMGLYSNPSVQDEMIQKAVADRLSSKRYRHTLGVLETAILLAAYYGVNLRKTYLAALLHDYAKEIKDEEKRVLCKDFGIPLDAIQEENISLMHGHLSAALARCEFDIEDIEILDAIRYHTTGRAGMGQLEKIIKIADNIEPNRPDYPGLDEIKALAGVSLDRGAVASIKRDIQYTKERGNAVHPLGVEALVDLEAQLM